MWLCSSHLCSITGETTKESQYEITIMDSTSRQQCVEGSFLAERGKKIVEFTNLYCGI